MLAMFALIDRQTEMLNYSQTNRQHIEQFSSSWRQQSHTAGNISLLLHFLPQAPSSIPDCSMLHLQRASHFQTQSYREASPRVVEAIKDVQSKLERVGTAQWRSCRLHARFPGGAFRLAFQNRLVEELGVVGYSENQDQDSLHTIFASQLKL